MNADLKGSTDSMDSWRQRLNQAAVDFWYYRGRVDTLAHLADAANAEMGEAHRDIWELFTCPAYDYAKQLILRNCCDWRDPGWTHENSPHLIAEVERVRKLLPPLQANR